MDQKSARRESRKPFRWMVALLIALVIAAVGWIAFSKASPESLVEPPTQTQTPSFSPR
jgi:hypothetical protein